MYASDGFRRSRGADDRLAVLATEGVDERHRDLDRLPTVDVLRAMSDAEAQVPGAAGAILPRIAAAVDAVAQRLPAGGRLIYVGTGTSGRLGVLDAAERPPTFHVDPTQVQAVMAGGRSVFEAVEGGRTPSSSRGRSRPPSGQGRAISLSASRGVDAPRS